MKLVHRRRAGPLSIAIGGALLAFAATAAACGFEDPSSIGMHRGLLNFAYPDSLHVGTAVWQAQLAGKLPREPLADPGDPDQEARARRRLVRAGASLGQLALRMSASSTASARPNVAVVLLGPMLWTRFESGTGAVRPRVHVSGPEPGDVVVVTEAAVVDAIAAGTLGFAGALGLGVVRLYGTAGDVAAVRNWFADLAPG